MLTLVPTNRFSPGAWSRRRSRRAVKPTWDAPPSSRPRRPPSHDATEPLLAKSRPSSPQPYYPPPSPAAEAALLAVWSSDDLLYTIGLCLCANALRPKDACTLGACCHGLRAAMHSPLAALRARHEDAKKLAAKVGLSGCAALGDAKALDWGDKGLNTADMRTLGALLESGALDFVEEIDLRWNNLGSEGARALCDALGRGAAPRLARLFLYSSHIGDDGATALAGALGRGAMPRLQRIGIGRCMLGDAGMASLAAPLRNQPGLAGLGLFGNEIGDAGVAALVDNLGPKEFKGLKQLFLGGNPVSDDGCAALAAALNGGALPALSEIDVDNTRAGELARSAVRKAAKGNDERRASAC